MEITAQQYISNSKDSNSFVKVFRHFFNSTEKKVDKKGDIYALLKISSEKSVKSERISKFVWDSIIDGYLYSNASTTNESLKDSISSGVKKVKDLIANDIELEEIGVDISFTIVLVKEEGVYVGIFGENDIFTFKKGSFVDIGKVLEEKKANTAGVVLEEGDLLMVSSSDILNNYVSRLEVLKKKEDFVKMLNAIGGSLQGTKALLYFSKEERQKKIVSERTTIKDSVNAVKESAQNLLKPIARVEKIKKPQEQGVLVNFKEKLDLNSKFSKAEEIFNGIWGKVESFLGKVVAFFKNIWNSVSENIVANLGKKRWYKRVASKFSEVRVGRRKPAGVTGMRIDDYKVRGLRGKRFKLLFMFLIILTLILLGINFTVKAKKSREISKLANESFVQIEELLGKSENSFVTDSASAETYLFQAEKKLSEITGELNDEDTEKFNTLRERVLEVGDSLYKRVGFVEGGTMVNYLDSRLSFGEGSDIVDLAISLDSYGNEYLFVADKGRKAVHRVSLYDKSVKTLPDNDGLVTSPSQVYVGVNGVYVYDEKQGMLKAAFNEEGWFSPFIQLSGLGVNDIKSAEITEMVAWTTSDNIYFMSKDRKALLKSTSAYGDRYGLTYAYIVDDRFEKSTDLIADLSIYVTISEEPHLLRFNYSFYENQYNEAPLSVLGFDGNYGNLSKAFTGDTLDSGLYLFDSGGRRFLRFEKPIESGVDSRHPNQILLLFQYVYRGEKDSALSDVRNFVVDFSEKNIYILDGSVIWKLGL